MDSLMDIICPCLCILPTLTIWLIMVLTVKLLYPRICSFLGDQLSSACMIGFCYYPKEKPRTHTVGSKGMILRDVSGVMLDIPENAITKGQHFDISMTVIHNTGAPACPRNSRVITPVAEFTSTGLFESFVRITFPVKHGDTGNILAFYRNTPKDTWAQINMNHQRKCDMYYVTNKHTVTIYTRHFTQFVCCCGTKNIQLSAYMFVSLKGYSTEQEIQLDVYIVHSTVRPKESYKSIRSESDSVPCGRLEDITKHLLWDFIRPGHKLDVKCVVQSGAWCVSDFNEQTSKESTESLSLEDAVRCHRPDPTDFRVRFYLKSTEEHEGTGRLRLMLRFFIHGDKREQLDTWTKNIRVSKIEDLESKMRDGDSISRDDALSMRSFTDSFVYSEEPKRFPFKIIVDDDDTQENSRRRFTPLNPPKDEENRDGETQINRPSLLRERKTTGKTTISARNEHASQDDAEVPVSNRADMTETRRNQKEMPRTEQLTPKKPEGRKQEENSWCILI